MANRLNNEQGFMLLEIMVSLAIISLGLIMVIRSFSLSQEAIKSSCNLNTANLLAQRKLWETKENGYPSCATIRGNFKEPYFYFGFKTEVKPTETENLRKVEVTIYHKSAPIMEVTAYSADRGATITK